MTLPKRIILLLDGTWNDSDFGPYDTNIVRIRDIIARSLWAENDESASREIESQAKDPKDRDDAPKPGPSASVTPKTFADKDNIVFYERGVGTGAFLDRFYGGTMGIRTEPKYSACYRTGWTRLTT
jgi:T6SS, Phospholipase effector Tle1-like, catalytic domain